MGKIKKHKHFGNRDPLKQREEREQKLIKEQKINNPPKEDQPISKRFKKFMEMKEAISQPKKVDKNEKKKKPQLGKRVTVHDDFDQNDNMTKKMMNETNKQHLRRVEAAIAKKKTEAEYAKKYGIQIVRDINGEIKMRKDPLTETKKKKMISKKELLSMKKPVVEKKPEDEPAENEPVFPLIKYKMSAKMKRKLEQEEQQVQPDYVKFGEVVKEPPTFHLSQKKNQKVTKPGKRDYLFLTKLNMK